MPAGRPRLVRTPLEAAQAASDGPGQPVKPLGSVIRAALRAADLFHYVGSINTGPNRVWVHLRLSAIDGRDGGAGVSEQVGSVLAGLWADGDTRVKSGYGLVVTVERAAPVPMPKED